MRAGLWHRREHRRLERADIEIAAWGGVGNEGECSVVRPDADVERSLFYRLRKVNKSSQSGGHVPLRTIVEGIPRELWKLIFEQTHKL